MKGIQFRSWFRHWETFTDNVSPKNTCGNSSIPRYLNLPVNSNKWSLLTNIQPKSNSSGRPEV